MTVKLSISNHSEAYTYLQSNKHNETNGQINPFDWGNRIHRLYL